MTSEKGFTSRDPERPLMYYDLNTTQNVVNTRENERKIKPLTTAKSAPQIRRVSDLTLFTFVLHLFFTNLYFIYTKENRLKRPDNGQS